MKLLIAYASKHGSTAEVAEKIAEVLRGRDIQVRVSPVQEINDLSGYDGFVLGTAIHAGTWLPELSTFMRVHHDMIGQRPVYLWINCIRIMEQYGYDHVMEFYVLPELLDGLNVRDKTALAGKLDLQSVDWNERWTLAARYDGSIWPSNLDGDFRDWQKVTTWADKVADDVLMIESAGKMS